MSNFNDREALKSFGEHYGYDISYMTHMLEAAPAAFANFAKITEITRHHEATPLEAHCAAGLVGALAEDCGPCVQLGVKMAEEAGMAPDQIAAVLTRDMAAMSADVAVAFRFADALARQDETLDDAREAARVRWGDAGVIELTLAMQVGRLYPMVKRGLGYAKTCQRISVAGRAVDVVKEAA